MDIDELLDLVLSLPALWKITEARLLKPQMQVEVFVAHEGKQAACPSVTFRSRNTTLERGAGRT